MKITIFGFAGSGTTTIGKLLAEKLNMNFMSSGNIMRNWAKENNMSIYEFEEKIAKKDLNFDINLDKKVELYGKNNKNFVFESRLAWNFIPKSFKIYLKCDSKIRYNRILERENTNLIELTKKTKIRETELIKRYKEVYPDLIFPPKEEIFDLTINVNTKTPNEILELILKKLD